MYWVCVDWLLEESDDEDDDAEEAELDDAEEVEADEELESELPPQAVNAPRARTRTKLRARTFFIVFLPIFR